MPLPLLFRSSCSESRSQHQDEGQVYSNSVNLYSDRRHGKGFSHVSRITFHILLIHYIRFQVEDEKNCFTDTVTNPFYRREDGKGQSNIYCLNCWATKTRSRMFTVPSPLGSGVDLPNPLATCTKSKMLTTQSPLTSAGFLVLR